MFNADELEALVLGARWVRHQGDPALAQAAQGVLDKLATASGTDLRERMAQTSLLIPNLAPTPPERFLGLARQAIRTERKLRIAYAREDGAQAERVVWPFALAFFEGKRILSAYCELRGAFRHFRVDRIGAASMLDEAYPTRRHDLIKAWHRETGIPEGS
jgi:predicted DNA-binding transcriptional regulator YafY